MTISDSTVAIIGTGNIGTRIEMFGDLHEYGALGRVVTKSEAMKAI
jgi:phosphoglycerate dehydrogenase-like enzyme